MSVTSLRILLPAATIAVLSAVSGCAGYEWTSSVPEAARTVSVPVFRNETDVTELGSKVTTQLLREFQREGTFAIRRVDDAALEVQGIVKRFSAVGGIYDRRSGARYRAVDFEAVADVSVIDKRRGRVLVDNRRYTGRGSSMLGGDRLTAERDASGRIAEDLARQVVDDLLKLDLSEKREKGKEDAK